MAEIYFHPLGSDAAAGTVSAPKQNPNLYSPSAGDVMRLCAGQVFTPPSGYGLSIVSNDVTVMAYGGADTPPKLSLGACSRGVSISNDVSGWSIQDLWLDGVGSGSNRRGITNSTTGSSETVAVNGLVQRVWITNVLTDGSTDCNGIGVFGANISILDCEIDGIATDGIWIRGKSAKIGRCRIMNVSSDDAARGAGFGDCIQFGGAGASDFTGGEVWDCTLDRRTSSTPKNGLIVNGASATTDFKAYGNTVLVSVVAGVTGVYLDVPGAKAFGNTVRGGAIGIYLGNASGGIATGNRVFSSTSGIQLSSGAVGALVANNSLAACGTGIYGSANDASTKIIGNLLRQCSIGMLRHASMQEDANAFDRCNTDVAWASSAGVLGGASRSGDFSALIDDDLALKVLPGTILDTLATDNPLAVGGEFIQGVRLFGGHRADPRMMPVGACEAVLARRAA